VIPAIANARVLRFFIFLIFGSVLQNSYSYADNQFFKFHFNYTLMHNTNKPGFSLHPILTFYSGW
jgi:hypothetical protein